MAKDYDISKTAGVCRSCGKELPCGEEFMAALKQAGDEFQREDYCLACWGAAGAQAPPEALATWKTKVPQPEGKKKLFVDDELLINFFEALEGTDEPSKISFRFVLALVLMRKKLLAYERSETAPDGRDLWTMRLKGTQQTYQLVDPHMDEAKIAEVSRSLGKILEADL